MRVVGKSGIVMDLPDALARSLLRDESVKPAAEAESPPKPRRRRKSEPQPEPEPAETDETAETGTEE